MLDPVASSWLRDVVGAVLDDLTISVGSDIMVEKTAARRALMGADIRRHCLGQCGVGTLSVTCSSQG